VAYTKIGASISARVWASAAMVPLWCIAGYVASDSNLILSAFGIIVFTIYIILYVSTTVVIIDEDNIRLRRLFLTKWSAARSSSFVEIGAGGDFNSLPALVVRSRADGNIVGKIVLTQYNKSDVERMKSLLQVTEVGTSRN
jgi:hypothetical protein